MFGFWSSYLKVYIHLPCINTQWQTTAPYFCAIVTGEFTTLILRKYSFKICMISSGFYSYHFKVYIHLPCINAQNLKTAPFYLLSPLSRVSLPYWSYKNTILRFVWYCLIFIHLILKLISIYSALTHNDEQQHHFIRDHHCHGWVYYIDTTKIWF